MLPAFGAENRNRVCEVIFDLFYPAIQHFSVECIALSTNIFAPCYIIAELEKWLSQIHLSKTILNLFYV